MLDNKGCTGSILMDLAKALDTINHELLVAKRNAYGCSKEPLKQIFSCLNNRKPRIKINKTFISWKELLGGALQGFVLL